MKYKVGDRVVIKPDAFLENAEHVIRDLKGTDRVYKITRVDSAGHFWAKARAKGKEQTCFCESLILGYAFDYGEEIEVSDCRDVWQKRKFCSYEPGSKSCVCVQSVDSPKDTYGYKYARPIRTPVIELTLKVNGEITQPSKFSEESWMNLRK